MADEEIYKDDEESIENAVQFTLDYLKRLPLTINQDDPDVEKDLNIFLTHKLQGDDSKLIFNSGLLFNLAHKIYAYSKKNQKKIIQIFIHWIECEDIFRILLLESGILANLTELLHNNRSVTIKFLISLCENPICAQRVAFSLSFSDFISEKPTTKPNINNDIELLLLLLEPNFEIFKRIFIDALCFIISENPEHISYIIFRIIEKIEESKFVKQILHLLQDQDIRKIIQSSSLPNDLNKTAIAMKIIDFLIDQNNEAKDGIFLDIISVYDDLLFDEKALIIHFIASFDFTTNDEFFSFFLKHDELIEFSDIKIIFDQILENLIKNDLQQIEALIEEDKWEQMYQRLL